MFLDAAGDGSDLMTTGGKQLDGNRTNTTCGAGDGNGAADGTVLMVGAGIGEALVGGHGHGGGVASGADGGGGPGVEGGGDAGDVGGVDTQFGRVTAIAALPDAPAVDGDECAVFERAHGVDARDDG